MLLVPPRAGRLRGAREAETTPKTWRRGSRAEAYGVGWSNEDEGEVPDLAQDVARVFEYSWSFAEMKLLLLPWMMATCLLAV